MKASFGTVVLVVGSVVVVAAIAAGVILVGTPTEGRLQRFDVRRVQDLQGIMHAADSAWARNRALPESIRELEDDPRMSVHITDPDTGEPYGYTVLTEDSYELCATFDGPSPELGPRPGSDFWRHGEGRHCFTLSVERSEGGEM